MEKQQRHYFNKGEILVFTQGEYSDYHIIYIYEVLIDGFDIQPYYIQPTNIVLAEAEGWIKELNFIKIGIDGINEINSCNSLTQNINSYHAKKNKVLDSIEKYSKELEYLDKLISLPSSVYTEIFDRISTVGELSKELHFRRDNVKYMRSELQSQMNRLNEIYLPLIQKEKELKDLNNEKQKSNSEK